MLDRRTFLKDAMGTAALGCGAMLSFGLTSITTRGSLPVQLSLRSTATETPPLPPPLVSNIREVTISTDRLDESVKFYRNHFGYQVAATAELKEQAWRRLWRLPQDTIARAVLMRIPGQEEGAFRLVQFRPTSKVFIRVAFRPLDTGHAGCDMTVPDLTARLGRMVDEGYNLASPRFSFVAPNTDATITEAIALGPTCERLPMVYYRQPDSIQSEPSSPSYVPVVSTFQGIASNIEEEASFYTGLGLQVTRDRNFDMPAVNEALGLPRDLRFRSIQLSLLDVPYGRVSLAQFFNYSGRNVSDRSDPPNLGILMTSFRTSDIRELLRRLRNLGAHIIRGPETIENPIYGSAQVICVKRPNGAWLEFYG